MHVVAVAFAVILLGATLYTVLVSRLLSPLSRMDGVEAPMVRNERETMTTADTSSFNVGGNKHGTVVTSSTSRTAREAQTQENKAKCQPSNLADSLEISANFSSIVAAHRAQIPELMTRARQRQRKGRPKGHRRFAPFSPLLQCKDVTSIGGQPGEDTSKLVCGLKNLQEGCIVYSIGGNNQWEFELDIVKQTPCVVYTLDCTGPRDRFQVPEHDRIIFEHICLGSQPEDGQADCLSNTTKCGSTMTLQMIQERLNHNKAADLLKIDIEGHEIPLFLSWNDASKYPIQILVEVHYLTTFKELVDDHHTKNGVIYHSIIWEFAFEEDIINLAAHLMDLGYFTVIRDDNVHCPSCTELSLIRVNALCGSGL